MTTADVSAITERVASLETEVRLGFTGVKDRLDRGDAHFQQMDARIGTIEDHIISQTAVNGYRKEHDTKQESREQAQQGNETRFKLLKRGKLYDLGLLLAGALISGGAGVAFQVISRYFSCRPAP